MVNLGLRVNWRSWERDGSYVSHGEVAIEEGKDWKCKNALEKKRLGLRLSFFLLFDIKDKCVYSLLQLGLQMRYCDLGKSFELEEYFKEYCSKINYK